MINSMNAIGSDRPHSCHLRQGTEICSPCYARTLRLDLPDGLPPVGKRPLAIPSPGREGQGEASISTNSWPRTNSSPRRHECDRHPRHQAAGGNSQRLGMALVGAGRACHHWRWRFGPGVGGRSGGRKSSIVPPVPAHVRAKQKLQEALALIAQPKPFVIAVSDTARYYLEERFDFHAPERTTEEFLHELQRTDLLTPRPEGQPRRFPPKLRPGEVRQIRTGRTGVARAARLQRCDLVEETEPVEVSSPKPKVQSPQPGMTFAHPYLLLLLLLLPLAAWLKGRRGQPPAFVYSSVQLLRARDEHHAGAVAADYSRRCAGWCWRCSSSRWRNRA